MKLQILHITLSSSIGGGPEHVWQLMKSQSKHQNVYIASPSDPPYFRNYVEIAGEDKHQLLPNRKFNFQSLYKLILFIKKNNINVIHSHGTGSGLYGRLASVFTGVPCVHTPHGIHIKKYNKPILKIYVLLEQMLSIFTKKIIHVSVSEKNEADNYKIFKWSSKVVIENGVETDLDNYKNKRDLMREKLGIRNTTTAIITVARFNRQKNMNYLYQIAKQCLDEDYVFIWLGDGDDYELLKNNSITDKVTNIKFIGPSREVHDYLAASDIYISASLWEGLPIAILEAMAMELPIVASDVRGNNDLVAHNENGYLFPLNEPEKGIMYLSQLKERDLRIRLGREGKKRVLLQYSIEKMNRSILQTYESVILRKGEN